MNRETLGDYGNIDKKDIPFLYKLRYILLSILLYITGIGLSYIVLNTDSKELILHNPFLFFLSTIILVLGTVLQVIGIVKILSVLLRK